MAYTVYTSSGTVLVNVANGEVDDVATSLDLIGKNINNYGEIINNNFVRLLNNFSNSTGPRSPQQGQLWYDSANNTLKVYNGSSWKSILSAYVSSTPPVIQQTVSGELWFDNSQKQLNVFVNGSANLIGPHVSPNLGKFGVYPTTSPYHATEYTTGDDKNVGVVSAYGRPFMVLSTYTFAASTSTSLYYFGTNSAVVYSGTNILNTLSVNKDLIVGGSLTVAGGILQAPDKTLTASYNSGWIGPFTTTYTATNVVIRTQLLPYLFSTSSNTWTNATAVNSEVKVVLTSGTFTATEIRHFILIRNTVSNIVTWEANEVYPATGTNYFNIVNTYTNVVRII